MEEAVKCNIRLLDGWLAVLSVYSDGKLAAVVDFLRGPGHGRRGHMILPLIIIFNEAGGKCQQQIAELNASLKIVWINTLWNNHDANITANYYNKELMI